MSIGAVHGSLQARLRDIDSVVVAYSGGVDSSVVAAVAADVLGHRALAVTAVSPALASGELRAARLVARQMGIAHEVIRTDELSRRGYVQNGTDRCYHCKDTLYTALDQLAADRGFGAVASGANVDDLGDWRPGLRAASEHGVVHPLVEARASKKDVRAIARELGLTNAEKVASPCLASRVPYGRPVRPEVLARIDRAEASVRALGFRELRVRDHGELGRLEVARDELERARVPELRDAILRVIHAAGYPQAEISEEPLQSGSLNRGIVDLPVLSHPA